MKEDNSDIFKLIMVFLVLLLVCITSCIKIDEPAASPRFKFGTNVYVTDGFYKGCKGRIDDYKYRGRSYYYFVRATCPYGKDSRYESLSDIEENLLVEDLSDGA